MVSLQIQSTKKTGYVMTMAIRCCTEQCGMHHMLPWNWSPACLGVQSCVSSMGCWIGYPMAKVPFKDKMSEDARRFQKFTCQCLMDALRQSQTNGRSHDSQSEQWIRFKQHNTAPQVVQCQLKQMGRWNSCVSKLIGCAASSWQPASVDVMLVTVIRLLTL